MNFLDKLKKTFGRSKPATSEIVTKIAKEIADQKNESFFARFFREARQYRYDVSIRREIAKTRAYAISSRPRLAQSSTKVVAKVKDYLELANGQVIRKDHKHRHNDRRPENPILRNFRQYARGESATHELKAA